MLRSIDAGASTRRGKGHAKNAPDAKIFHALRC